MLNINSKRLLNLATLISMSLFIQTNLYSNNELFVNQEIIKNKDIDDSFELTVKSATSNKTLFTPLDESTNKKDEYFTLNTLMDDNVDWNFSIEPTIPLDKEYSWKSFGTNDWKNILREIAGYDDLLIIINEQNRTIELSKKTKAKFNIINLEEPEILDIINSLKSKYKNVEIYKYKSIIYIEGNKQSVEKILNDLEKMNKDVKQSMNKYVISLYKYNSDKDGLLPMIDKFNKSVDKKIIIQNPKINKQYFINLGSKELIIKINSNDVEINGAIIKKDDLKYYGYILNGWFVDIKLSEF